MNFENNAPASSKFVKKVVIHNDTAYVSGQLPREGGEIKYLGKVGKDLDIESAKKSARLCVQNCFKELLMTLGNEKEIERVIKMTGFVASSSGFNQQPAVIDAASEFIYEQLGECGPHARSAIGVAELPHGASVEIEIIAAIKNK